MSLVCCLVSGVRLQSPSVLLQAEAQLVVGGGEFHQRFLDPQSRVSHLAVLVPTLRHELTKTEEYLVLSPPVRDLRSVLVHTHHLVHVFKPGIWRDLQRSSSV